MAMQHQIPQQFDAANQTMLRRFSCDIVADQNCGFMFHQISQVYFRKVCQRLSECDPHASQPWQLFHESVIPILVAPCVCVD
jgi:hypothetical protein